MGADYGDSKGPVFLVFALLLTVLAMVFVSLRVYIRTKVNYSLGWDDALIIIAVLLAIISTSFNVPEVVAGYGRHMSQLSVRQLIQILRWNYLCTCLLVLSLAASKASICLFLLRLLRQTRTRFKRSFPIAIILISTTIAIPSAGYALGQCQPVRKLWDPSTPGHCQDSRIFIKLGYANGAINAFSDFVLALFPISFIRELRLPLHKRVVLGTLMSCGVICGSLAITRTILTGDLTAKSDTTFDSVNSSMFAIVEENVSIIVACIPTLGSLFQSIADKIKSMTSTNNSSKRGYQRHDDQANNKPVPLRPILQPPYGDFPYAATSFASAKGPLPKGSGGYEREVKLMSGIERTTTVEVQRGTANV